MPTPKNERELWILSYGLAMGLGMLAMKGRAAPGFEERFAERLDVQARAVADQVVTTFLEKGIV